MVHHDKTGVSPFSMFKFRYVTSVSDRLCARDLLRNDEIVDRPVVHRTICKT